MTEEWRPVVGYEGLYEVSDLGRLRSMRRMGTPGRIVQPYVGHNGYLSVKLHRRNVRLRKRVHRLVGEAFIGPLPPGMHTLHGAAGKLDNSLANLRYGTPADNQADRLRDGTLRCDSRSKLSSEIVTECRVRYALGETTGVLASTYGVTTQAMWMAVTGRSWRSVAAEPASFAEAIS